MMNFASIRPVFHSLFLSVWIAVIGCASGSSTAKTDNDEDTQSEIEPIESAGLHNTFKVSDRVFSGSSPDGEPGFASLEKLGIKTILSVDGAKPDIESAKRHGMRYVHLPIGYDGIPRERIVALVRAMNELPAPIYVHCHHGKHRGPTAVAVMMLCSDAPWDAERAELWLKTAGTDGRYTGLIGLPRTLERPTEDEFSALRIDFPSVSVVADLTRLMVEVDARWDHLKIAKAAGWTIPKEHPDIDPAHEAVQLMEHYREAIRLPVVQSRGVEFASQFEEAVRAASELELGLRAKPPDLKKIDNAFARTADSCSACHKRFRDRPVER